MALDLSKIKGISDDVKAKLGMVKNQKDLDALVKAENLSEDQLKELSGGEEPLTCSTLPAFDWCPEFVCCPIDK